MSMGAKKHSRKKNIENVSMFKKIKDNWNIFNFIFLFCFFFSVLSFIFVILEDFFRIGQKFITTVIITNSSYIFLISKTKKICRWSKYFSQFISQSSILFIGRKVTVEDISKSTFPFKAIILYMFISVDWEHIFFNWHPLLVSFNRSNLKLDGLEWDEMRKYWKKWPR